MSSKKLIPVLLSAVATRSTTGPRRTTTCAVLRGDVVGSLALEHGDDLRVRAPQHPVPQVLEPVGLDDPQRGVAHHLLGAPGDERRRRLGPIRQAVGDLALEVGRFDQRVRDADGDGLLHRGVVGERRHRVDELIRVQDRVADPDAHDGDRHEQADEHDEDTDQDAPPARQLRLDGGLSLSSGINSWARLDHRSPPCARQCSARTRVERSECNPADPLDPGTLGAYARAQRGARHDPHGAATVTR